MILSHKDRLAGVLVSALLDSDGRSRLFALLDSGALLGVAALLNGPRFCDGGTLTCLGASDQELTGFE